VADELQELHAAYAGLARQLAADADCAPYAHVAERLKQLEMAEERNALAVSERLAVLGRHAGENGTPPLRPGRNAWDRLVVLLEGYRDLIRRLTGLMVRWDDERPEDAALVRDLRDHAMSHRAVVSDLMARSDPHALD
jgi:hypothetical protein